MTRVISRPVISDRQDGGLGPRQARWTRHTLCPGRQGPTEPDSPRPGPGRRGWSTVLVTPVCMRLGVVACVAHGMSRVTGRVGQLALWAPYTRRPCQNALRITVISFSFYLYWSDSRRGPRWTPRQQRKPLRRLIARPCDLPSPIRLPGVPLSPIRSAGCFGRSAGHATAPAPVLSRPASVLTGRPAPGLPRVSPAPGVRAVRNTEGET